ncbi:MAG: ribosome maturation factor RimM [Candidatus Obscuribacterales bacterium]|jgi:16S rRNA processing protein RimM
MERRQPPNLPGIKKKLEPVGEGTYTFAVGLVTGVKGLRGDLKLKLKGNIDLIDKIKTVQIATADGARQIAHVRSFKTEQKLVLMSLKEFEDRTASEGIIGATLFTERSQLNALSEDEWWLDDLVGLTAFTVEGEELGKVSAVFGETSQLLEITKGEKSHLVPFVKALVPVVDIKAGRVEIVNLPGLFE